MAAIATTRLSERTIVFNMSGLQFSDLPVQFYKGPWSIPVQLAV
jgi:hypothetical protein